MYFIYTACFYLIPPTLGTEEEKDSLRKTRGAYQNVVMEINRNELVLIHSILY